MGWLLIFLYEKLGEIPFGHFEENNNFPTVGMSLDAACTQANELYPSSLRVKVMNPLLLQFILCWSRSFQKKE